MCSKVASYTYHWCTNGCGKKVTYIGKTLTTMKDRKWFQCSKCKKKYKKEELKYG